MRRIARRRSAPGPLPGEQHRAVGELYLGLFVELGGLQPDESVLEPGCGTGRMAEPLTAYLSASGSYDGFDVVADAVRVCEEKIAPAHPNFRFRHVDVFNRAYNPNGRLDPDGFAFPYPDDAFDFAFLTSVFTHMRPPEVRRYLGEIRRVLHPGGRCLMTFFLLNDESVDAIRRGRASRRFAHEGDGYRYDVAERPEAALAYREEDVLAFLQEAGLELHAPVRRGRWTGRDEPPNQDTVVVHRPARS